MELLATTSLILSSWECKVLVTKTEARADTKRKLSLSRKLNLIIHKNKNIYGYSVIVAITVNRNRVISVTKNSLVIQQDSFAKISAKLKSVIRLFLGKNYRPILALSIIKFNLL